MNFRALASRFIALAALRADLANKAKQIEAHGQAACAHRKNMGI